ncbi:MAG: hypothetical protein ABSH41_04090 [Syntrophobacteraceae bacterium]
MKRKSNQEIEECYFNQFQKHYSLPPGEINFSDRPDVILSGERKIGIEITNFFLRSGNLPESEQVQAKLRKRIVSESQKIYLSGSSKKMEISLGFDMDCPIGDRKEQLRLIKDIVQLARQIEGIREGEVERSRYGHIRELSFVYINFEEYHDPKWQIVQTYSLPMMATERLKEIIENKETEAINYQKCDAYWLLCVIDFINRAQDQQIDSAGIAGISLKIFEKVIIYKTVFGEVVEIDNH